MDIATVLGIVGGFGLIVVSISMGGGLGGFADMPSVAVVFGGTIAASMIMFPLGEVIRSIKVGFKTIMARTPDPEPVIQEIIKLAEIGRKEGIVALEKVQISNEFLRKGVRLVADGSPKNLVLTVLDTEIDSMSHRHKQGQDVFKGMGMVAPAFGMIGTLIGLVRMLQTLDDPSSIGPAMAVALLTTFYGAIMANVLFLPMAKKLEVRSGEESFLMRMIRDGVISIINGEHPMMVREKLFAFLSPNKRQDEAGKKG